MEERNLELLVHNSIDGLERARINFVAIDFDVSQHNWLLAIMILIFSLLVNFTQHSYEWTMESFHRGIVTTCATIIRCSDKTTSRTR